MKKLNERELCTIIAGLELFIRHREEGQHMELFYGTPEPPGIQALSDGEILRLVDLLMEDSKPGTVQHLRSMPKVPEAAAKDELGGLELLDCLSHMVHTELKMIEAVRRALHKPFETTAKVILVSQPGVCCGCWEFRVDLSTRGTDSKSDSALIEKGVCRFSLPAEVELTEELILQTAQDACPHPDKVSRWVLSSELDRLTQPVKSKSEGE